MNNSIKYTAILVSISLFLVVIASNYYTATENIRIAFIADQGINENSRKVLELIKSENADLIVNGGDLDYLDNPDIWNEFTSETLGDDFPIISAMGSHDITKWPEYKRVMYDRMLKNPDLGCRGELGEHSICQYHGLSFLLSSIGADSNTIDFHLNYLNKTLQNNDSPWEFCVWHKNSERLQVGYIKTEVPIQAYEICREQGALIINAHLHSYARTNTLTNMDKRTVLPGYDKNEIILNYGSSAVIISGLGGASQRDQQRCFSDCPEWAAIYTSNQFATAGALFCDFKNNKTSDCYFKNIDGKIIDEFTLINEKKSLQNK